MRVLFVDDDEAVSQSVETALRRKGHAVDTAGLGSDALALMENSSYDIVVLDVGLPDMDGYHIVRRMKIDQIETPVLMQTGLAGQDLIEDAETLGVRGILAKPFSIHELLECMASIFMPSDDTGQDSAVEPDPAGPPRMAPQPERQSAPQPAPSPDPASPPQQTAQGTVRALRRALEAGTDPATDVGPKVRPAAAPEADPGPPPAPEPSPDPAVEPEVQPLGQAAPAPPLERLPEPDTVEQAAPAHEIPADDDDDDDDERRRSERVPMIEGALITEEGEIMACVILDISQNGARVKLAAPSQSCPKMFNLKPLNSPERRCEVRWRSGAHVGLKFI